ncbi:hypothetical protein OAO01_05815 [Oligoflexia bacterium]|nr:hypothetical protein [Oligoflexia bacterium]
MQFDFQQQYARGLLSRSLDLLQKYGEWHLDKVAAFRTISDEELRIGLNGGDNDDGTASLFLDGDAFRTEIGWTGPNHIEIQELTSPALLRDPEWQPRFRLVGKILDILEERCKQ